ncbi:MAG TPA: undecaprenyl-diphosphate phosphatase [Microthrixaceae bacterium]|nr:undecaprenyl-diphosphate phosphatase [Microthrixaceae bacterium]
MDATEFNGNSFRMRNRQLGLRPVPPWIGRRPSRGLLAAPILVVLLAVIVSPAGAAEVLTGIGSASATVTETAMTAWKAALLGIIEGLTEYLPISSTGHLLVASDLLGLGTTDADIKAANTYAIAIQFGAILAVAGLFWKRFRDMLLGLVGKSDEGRHLLLILIVAFAPAAVLGFLFDDKIEEVLFSSWPIIGAWVVGGILILALERSGRIPRRDEAVEAGRDRLLEITVRQAAIIGLIQCLAMWPGTSRSLAAILGALLVGVSMGAAVEFSFLLGFVTLSAASGYSLLSDGGALIDQFGIVNPLIGLLFAFVSAVIAIKWMIGYLQNHSLAVFGWYRIVAAGLAAGLVISGALNA